MSGLIQGARVALRTLRRQGQASALAVLALTLGIGLSTALFSVLDGVALRGLPFPDGDRFVSVTTYRAYNWPMPAQDYRDVAERQRVFAEMGAFRTYNAVVTREGGGSKGLTATYVTGNLFQALGVDPILGRSFTSEDEESSAPSVAMLSHHVWQSHFAGDPEILGQTTILNREPMTIIGVMPEGFRFPVRQEAWAVLRWQGRPWSDSAVFAIGKLPPGKSPARAEHELVPLVESLELERPLDETRQVHVTRYVDAVLPEAVPRALRVLVLAGFAILLIACSNVANLRLEDALARRSELAVRRALGASDGRLVRLLLAESAVLVAMGATLGLALAAVLVRLASAFFLQGSMLIHLFWVDIRLDARSFSFVVAIAGVTVMLSALAPSLWAIHHAGLQTVSRSTRDRRETRIVMGVVAAQVAACFVLLVGAGLLIRSGLSLLAPQPGFDSSHLIRSIVNTYQVEQGSPDSRRAFWEQLLSRLEQDPSIAGATFASGVPWLSWNSGTPVRIDPTSDLEPQGLPKVSVMDVYPGFFETLRFPVLRGRVFDRGDLSSGEVEDRRDRLVVVSSSFARRHFRDRALGRTFEILPTFGDRTPIRASIIGVVADRGLDRSDRPFAEDAIYTPVSFFFGGGGFLIVRGAGGTAGLEALIDREIEAIDPLIATLDWRTFEQERAERTWVERRLAQLFAVFAGGSLALSAVGLYGVVALWRRRRGRELAIRAALGALPRDLASLLLRVGARCIGLGLVLGATVALVLTRFLEQFLYEVEPSDPWVFLLSLGAIVAMALLSILGQAVQAARTDPASMLHAE